MTDEAAAPLRRDIILLRSELARQEKQVDECIAERDKARASQLLTETERDRLEETLGKIKQADQRVGETACDPKSIYGPNQPKDRDGNLSNRQYAQARDRG